MITREAENKLRSLAEGFPAVAVIGPRQSGKTLLVQKVFPTKRYVLLEDPETRSFAEKDPRGFLAQFRDGAILDEVQRVPHLFSYMQGMLDAQNKPGMFILSGSQNFLFMETITQSLAGRIAIIKLLPFTKNELDEGHIVFENYEDYLWRGMYPRLYDMRLSPGDFYASYVQTYLERDLRQIKNIHDLSAFQTFLKMCAQRIGRLLNLSSLATDCGITHNTAKAWLSLLETSFIIFLLRPHHKNFNKRLVKMPKLYFYDSGLAAYLAGIQNQEHMAVHPLKGGLFESFILSEFLKSRFNQGLADNIFFWRDKVGHEIDCIIEDGTKLKPIEIKSGRTITNDYFDNSMYWSKLSGNNPKNSIIVYGGDVDQKRHNGHVVSWRNITAQVRAS